MGFSKSPSAAPARTYSAPPAPRTFNTAPVVRQAPAAPPPPAPRVIDRAAPPAAASPIIVRKPATGAAVQADEPKTTGFSTTKKVGTAAAGVAVGTAVAGSSSDDKPKVDSAGRFVQPENKGGFSVSRQATPQARAAAAQEEIKSIRSTTPTKPEDVSANLGARLRVGRQAEQAAAPAAQPLPQRQTRSELQADLQRTQAQRDQARQDVTRERDRAAYDYSRGLHDGWYRDRDMYYGRRYNDISVGDIILHAWAVNTIANAMAHPWGTNTIVVQGGGMVVGTAGVPQGNNATYSQEDIRAVRDALNARAGDVSDQYRSVLRKLDDAARTKDLATYDRVWDDNQMIIQLVLQGSADADGKPTAIGGRSDLAIEKVRAELAGSVKAAYNDAINRGYSNAQAAEHKAEEEYKNGDVSSGDRSHNNAVQILDGLRPTRTDGENMLAAINCDDDLMVNVDLEASIRNGAQRARIEGAEKQLERMVDQIPAGANFDARKMRDLGDQFNQALLAERDTIEKLKATPVEGIDVAKREAHVKALVGTFYKLSFDHLYAYGETNKSKVSATAQTLWSQSQTQVRNFGITENPTFGRDENREKTIDSKAASLSLSL